MTNTKHTPKPQLSAALFGNSSLNSPKILDLDIELLSPNPDQPRKFFSEESLWDLANSIESQGLIQPIVVKKDNIENGKYIIISGERRWRAHKLLNKSKIYSIVSQTGNIDELALVENIQREDLNIIEEAQAFSRLMEKYGYTQEALGKVLGRAQSVIGSIVVLNNLPDKIKIEYAEASGKISKSLMIELASHGDADDQLAIWNDIKQGTITVKSFREIKRSKREKEPLPKNIQYQVQSRPTLLAGRLFIKRLESIESNEIDSITITELLKIKESIDVKLNALTKINYN